MSPVQAMERSYAALRQMLRDGACRPGDRLEATRIADGFGVSMTPVRDALNRLAGEQLVEASSGDGFHVPWLGEGDLRDLYEWNSALVAMAARTATAIPGSEAVASVMDCGSLPDATAACFTLLAETAPNRELRRGIAQANDRLHPFRLAEARIIAPVLGELEGLLASGRGQLAAIRRYHLIRMRAAEALIRERSQI